MERLLSVDDLFRFFRSNLCNSCISADVLALLEAHTRGDNETSLKKFFARAKNMSVLISHLHYIQELAEKENVSQVCALVRIIREIIHTFGDAYIPTGISRLLFETVLTRVSKDILFKSISGIKIIFLKLEPVNDLQMWLNEE